MLQESYQKVFQILKDLSWCFLKSAKNWIGMKISENIVENPIRNSNAADFSRTNIIGAVVKGQRKAFTLHLYKIDWYATYVKTFFDFFFLRNSLQNACLHKIASWWTVWLTLEILINIRLLRKSLPIIMLTFYQKSTIDLVEVFPNIL